MKTLLVSGNGGTDALARALQAEGVEIKLLPPEALPAGVGDEVGQIARALVSLETLLVEDAPDAVVLASASNLALAAVLAATKLRIPVACLEDGMPGEDRLSDINRRLIEQLADVTLTPDAGAVAAWLRDRVAA